MHISIFILGHGCISLFTIFPSLKKPHACIFWSFPKGKQFSFPVNQEESLQFDICEWHMQSCLQHNIVPR
jgi:hypothetical protein